VGDGRPWLTIVSPLPDDRQVAIWMRMGGANRASGKLQTKVVWEGLRRGGGGGGGEGGVAMY